MRKVTLITIIAMLGLVVLFSGCPNPATTSAKVYIQQNNYDKAIEQAKLATEQNPADAEAWFVLGQAYALKKNFKESNDAFDQSLAASPRFTEQIKYQKEKNWADLFNSGTSLIRQDKIDKAVENFNLAIEILPNRIEAYKNLAYAYGQQNNDEKGIETYLKAIEIAPKDYEIKNFLGTLYYRGKMYDKAIPVLSEVVENVSPDSALYSEALYNLAYSYDLSGDSDKAIGVYMKALETHPKDKDLLFNLARIYYMQEKYDMSVEYFQKVLDIDLEDFDANMNIANAYLQMEKYEEAVPYYEKATTLNPENSSAWNNLGVAYVRSGMPEKGKAAFDKAEELQ